MYILIYFGIVSNEIIVPHCLGDSVLAPTSCNCFKEKFPQKKAFYSLVPKSLYIFQDASILLNYILLLTL